ncbi:DUF2975 domain-containing protein [Isoptericola halotolerans]|uniref:DUF2975 domain-containing protein n=1 Tax=Isoptericola halotolerans TaxID=300560 RepID=UPI00388EA3F3
MTQAHRLSIRSDGPDDAPHPGRRRTSARAAVLTALIALAAVGDGALLLGGPTTTTLTITAPTLLQRLLVFAPATVLCATVVVCGVLLRRMLRSVEAGDPFHRDNPRRVAATGVIVLVGGVVAAGLTTLGRLTALDPTTLGLQTPASAVGGPSGAVELPVTALVVAATLWVVAAVLRRGSSMHADLQGLV